MNKNFRRGNFRGNIRSYGRQNSRGEYKTGIGMTVMAEVGTGLERGHFPEIMTIIEIEAQAKVGSGQDPELAQIGIEFIIISVGNAIISQGIVPLIEKKRKLNNVNEC